MVTFQKASDYVLSCSGNNAKIAAIDAIIDQLLVAALTAAESGHLKEYWLNDGQVQIRCNYSTPESIERSILSFRRLRNMYINDRNGRVVRLVDASNLNGGYGRKF